MNVDGDDPRTEAQARDVALPQSPPDGLEPGDEATLTRGQTAPGAARLPEIPAVPAPDAEAAEAIVALYGPTQEAPEDVGPLKEHLDTLTALYAPTDELVGPLRPGEGAAGQRPDPRDQTHLQTIPGFEAAGRGARAGKRARPPSKTRPPSGAEAASAAEGDTIAKRPSEAVHRRLTDEHPGRYSPMEVLGQGGIGVVRCALDHHLEREVAVKELKGVRDRVAGGVEARFVGEARVTGQLEHPGIVPVYELGRRQDGTLYYVMRRIRGQTLGDAMKGRGLPGRLQLLPRLIDVCQAMAYAHSRGVIHRDLKPANVMLGEFGETLVVDWGLAKAKGSDPHDLTATTARLATRAGPHSTLQGQVMGTPAYMPPEQARGDVGAIDARSDVYALGAILYHLLTGQAPHQGSSTRDVLRSARAGGVRPPWEVAPGSPRDLGAIAMRALRTDPDARYPDARSMVADLEAFQTGGLVGAYRYRRLELMGRWLRRHRTQVIAACALLMVASATWWYRGMEEQRSRLAAEAARVAGALAQVSTLIDGARAPRDAGWLDTTAYRLIALKEPAVEADLAHRLADAHENIRRLAARALGGMGSRAAVAPLMARLAPGVERDQDVVIEVIRALGIIGDPAADKTVSVARRRYGQWSYVWQNTTLAYEMLPPAEIRPEDLDKADKWVDRGSALVEKQRAVEAIAMFDHALSLDPTSARAWTNRGMAWRIVGDLVRSVADHSQALAHKRDFPWALANRAVALRFQRHYDESLRDAERLIARNKELVAVGHRSRALLLWYLDRMEEARQDANRALELQPRSTQSFAKLATHELAIGQPGAALRWLDRANQLNANDVRGWVLRGQVLVQLGRLEDARHALDRVVALNPRHASGLAMRGHVLLVQGDATAAQADFDRAVELLGERATAWAERAVLYHAARGQWPAALRDLDAALARAYPAERVWLAIMRHAVARTIDPKAPPPAALQPNGQVPWQDALIEVVSGRREASNLAARRRSPQERCELAVAAWLWASETGREVRLAPPPTVFARQPGMLHDLECALAARLDTDNRYAALPGPATGVANP